MNIEIDINTKEQLKALKDSACNKERKLSYRYILFDKWFASIKNLVFIEEKLKKKFVCPIKSNRKIALTTQQKNKGRYVNIQAIDIEGGSSRLIYLEGYEKPLKLIKQVVL